MDPKREGSNRGKTSPKHTISGDERRRSLIVAACEQIAEKGFEGFRVRDVASQVGINNATLHYYFPTKEALIQAVVDYIMGQFLTVHDPNLPKEPETPLEALQAHFSDILYQMQVLPWLFLVLHELFLRSRRDPAIHAILKESDRNWYTMLHTMLNEGIEQGILQANLDPQEASLVMMALVKGLTLHLESQPEDRQRAVDQLFRWLCA